MYKKLIFCLTFCALLRLNIQRDIHILSLETSMIQIVKSIHYYSSIYVHVLG